MAFSEVSICNLAIARVGGTLISSLTENVKTARLCNVFYSMARDSLLEEDVWWTFATERQTLPRLTASPETEFEYAYQLPSDLVMPRYIVDGTEVEYDIEGLTLVTDATEVDLVYTKIVTDPALFTQSFADALSLKIASDLALPITNRATNQANFIALYDKAVAKAKKADMRKKQRKQSMSSRWLNSRTGRLSAALPKKLNSAQS